MNTEFKNILSASDKDAQYDERAKRLLGHKIILAHILAKTVDEFKGMHPKDIAGFIEGEPYISIVPVTSGLTNIKTHDDSTCIMGFNTENFEINEGLIRFDIVFYVRLRNGLSQIIVNIEAQKDEPADYNILNSAVFYVSRLVSSQKGRDFVNTDYDSIKQVYSIWVCMNMKKNSMIHIHLTKDNLVGDYEWNGRLDLINIIFIGLSHELPEHNDDYELHRLLGALLSDELPLSEKFSIVEGEYNIPVENVIEREVGVMCNLSQGIKEKGIAIGEARIINSMYNNNFSVEKIAEITDKSVEEIKAIVEQQEAVLL